MARIRTKARALDLLGRQQIAGIPTALSELFKNAHDAYADNVEVDFIRKSNLLVLRDDGLGMTKDEFEERWLTIGTDSKLEDEDSIGQPEIDKGKVKRQVMGEKGVGRLSIAAIGPQVLVITRPIRAGQLGKLVLALVNWTLFSFPRLDLEDITIPIREVTPDELSEKTIEDMKHEVLLSLKSLKGKISDEKIERVSSQISGFVYNPIQWAEQFNDLDRSLELPRNNLDLINKGHGTHFIISPVDEILEDEIDESNLNKSRDSASRLEKALLGFTNTMYADSKPPIIARFRDHTRTGECIDRISEAIFYTPEEFEAADHHFEGTFNEFGQFQGEITIYGETRSTIISWPQALNKETLCGPFRLKLAYVHGAQRDSRMPPEIWREVFTKTNRFGGLYIYRDGIRILPYGDSDFDWLGIEQRRSKSASEYFFSYRRMFGSVELTRQDNFPLVEKAGREGFIENRAYKQLKEILKNFFIQIAADYFQARGELSDLFLETRKRHQEQHEALAKRSKLKTEKKKKLRAKLDSFFKDLDQGRWDKFLQNFDEQTEELFTNFDPSLHSMDDFVFEVENLCKGKRFELQNSIDFDKPAGLGFGKDLNDAWDLYQVEKNQVKANFERSNESVNRRLVQLEDSFGDRTGLRRRFHESIKIQQEYHHKHLNDLYSHTSKAIESLQSQLKQTLKQSKILEKDKIASIEAEFNSANFKNKSSDELYELKTSLESKIDETASEISQKLTHLTEQINTAVMGTDENAISSNHLTAVLESEYEHLKEQHERNLEMAQLGMALGVINHEFNSNIGSIRRGLKEMQPFAKRSERFNEIFLRVRSGFEHLEGYLRTFTPLTKRLARRNVIITGKAISEFLTSVFEERLAKEEIELKFSSEFLRQSVFGFTSTIYPAFINIVDNAIHWVSKSTGEKTILLDSTTDGFLVTDTGPGIPTIDQENVFEFGFSRRMGGQGMGLYITKETLERDGFQIILKEYSPKRGASIEIKPKEDNSVE